MKLTVIGGGSVRSMFLAKILAKEGPVLGIRRVIFMDNDAEKLHIYGGMAKEVAKRIDPTMEFELTLDPVEAVKDAQYVITALRVGGDDLRATEERFALNFGVLGQETTGVCGFSFAMRSVAVLTEYCELCKRYAAPDVKVFNFTNPAGIVSEALRKAGYDFTYGICDAPSGMLQQFAALYGKAAKDIDARIYGLNHLSFFSGIYLNGEEISEKLISDPDAYLHTDLRFFSREILEKYGVSNEYLYYYFYPEKAVENLLKAKRSRGEVIASINREMTAELKRYSLAADFETMMKRFAYWYGLRENAYMASETGVKRDTVWRFDLNTEEHGYAGVALNFIRLSRKDGGGNMILCVPNSGKVVDGCKETDVVETACHVSKEGIIPLRANGQREICTNLIQNVKEYERIGAEAILEKDRKKAETALKAHPLAPNELCDTFVKEWVKRNAPYTGVWA